MQVLISKMTARRLTGSLPFLFATHFLCLLFGTHAASVFQAYRLVQYDQDGIPAGSRTVRLAQVRTLFSVSFHDRYRGQYATLKREGAKLFRSVVLLPVREATLQLVKEILDPSVGVAGLVFLLPPINASAESIEEIDIDLFSKLEKFLILKSIAIPIYFIEETEELQSIVGHSVEACFEMCVHLDDDDRQRYCGRETSYECKRRISAAS